MTKMALVPYQTPERRALAMLYRQLAVDAALMLLGGAAEVIGRLADGETLGVRALAYAAVLLIMKTAVATLVKYQAALADDAADNTLNFPEE